MNKKKERKMIKTEFRITKERFLRELIEKLEHDIKYNREQADNYKKKEMENSLLLGMLKEKLKESESEEDLK